MAKWFAVILFVLSAQLALAAGVSAPPTCWSADGGKIVIAAKLADGQGIYILDPDGRKQEHIPFAHAVLAIKWRDKDEAMCLLARQSDGRCYLWLANPTGIIERLSNRPVYIGETPSADLFDCSPDGRYAVFPSGSGSNVDLWRADTEGGPEKQLTNSKGRDLSPSWSPNGRLIAFESERGGTRGIWVMSADGGSVPPDCGRSRRRTASDVVAEERPPGVSREGEDRGNLRITRLGWQGQTDRDRRTRLPRARMVEHRQVDSLRVREEPGEYLLHPRRQG